MKNLFEYATKELSQDAFLRWFIENDYNGSGRELLGVLANVDPNKITNIKTWAQSERIDICVDFNVGVVPHILIIEDKVNTREHSNQLERYMKTVQKWNNANDNCKNRKCHFIFYKTRILENDEKEYIESTRIDGLPFKWIAFDLLKINLFFEKYLNSDNLIINQYAEYIHNLTKDSTNEDIPTEHRIIAWKSFFNRVVKPRFNNTKFDVCVAETFYGYSFLNFWPKNCDKAKTPYLEIRSRDCLDNHMVGRILLYNVNIPDEQKNVLKQKIETEGKLFKKENNSQQIASTNIKKKGSIAYKNQEDFINKVFEMAEEYKSFIV